MAKVFSFPVHSSNIYYECPVLVQCELRADPIETVCYSICPAGEYQPPCSTIKKIGIMRLACVDRELTGFRPEMSLAEIRSNQDCVSFSHLFWEPRWFFFFVFFDRLTAHISQIIDVMLLLYMWVNPRRREKSTFRNELDVRKPLVVSVSH
jgi:hypothetical protein